MLCFLLHWLLFEIQEGKVVTIKSHLLLHAFATEADHRHEIPVDRYRRIASNHKLNKFNPLKVPHLKLLLILKI